MHVCGKEKLNIENKIGILLIIYARDNSDGHSLANF